jgi:hypothetical protein
MIYITAILEPLFQKFRHLFVKFHTIFMSINSFQHLKTAQNSGGVQEHGGHDDTSFKLMAAGKAGVSCRHDKGKIRQNMA